MFYFIVNSTAGTKRAKKAAVICDEVLREQSIEYTMLYTEKPNDTKRIEELIDFENANAIIVIGGDGTIQEYVGLAIRYGVKLGIIPGGSGNDVITSFPGYEKRKFNKFRDKIEHYLKRVIIGETAKIDAISVNGTYLLNIGGTGIDISVLRDAVRMKKRLGGLAYFAALVKNVVTYKAEKLTITIDGEAESGEYLLLAICNGAYYGGGLNIAPAAQINDGFITICKIVKLSRLKMVTVFPSVKPGKHGKVKGVSFMNCTTLKLEFEGTKAINLDGNIIEMESPLVFEIHPGAVEVIV